MPAIPHILKLPSSVRTALDEEIRLNRYSGYANIAAWLSECHGYKISKTTIAVYGKVLAQKDTESGISDFGSVRPAIAVASRSSQRLDDLLRELGRARLRELELIAEIQALQSQIP
ncbi:DUF3486 family protein [Stenotrophomonas maltophilia]|nr:DUF3486 family protein [Stenotrophomonas maltophilia]